MLVSFELNFLDPCCRLNLDYKLDPRAVRNTFNLNLRKESEPSDSIKRNRDRFRVQITTDLKITKADNLGDKIRFTALILITAFKPG